LARRRILLDLNLVHRYEVGFAGGVSGFFAGVRVGVRFTIMRAAK
jgi:hypothetical protein